MGCGSCKPNVSENRQNATKITESTTEKLVGNPLVGQTSQYETGRISIDHNENSLAQSPSLSTPSPTKKSDNQLDDRQQSQQSTQLSNKNSISLHVKSPAPVIQPVSPIRLPKSPSVRSRKSLVSQTKPDGQSLRSSSLMMRKECNRIQYCPYCSHCRRLAGGQKVKRSKTPDWIIKNPTLNGCRILMDNYDIEAVKEKVIQEVGHMPGCYDYQPYLTIEEKVHPIENQEPYCTHPYVARTSPAIIPTFTPFPEYKELNNRERYLSKPYTTKLYHD